MADQKLSQLTAKTTVASTDLLYMVDPSSKRITVSNYIQNIGPVHALTPPVDSQFSWQNQGGASIATGDYGISLITPATAGNSLRVRDKAAPATPYTITAGIRVTSGGDGTAIAGIGWRDSGTGTIALIGPQNAATFANCQIVSAKFTNPTTFSAYYVNPLYQYAGANIWLQASDTGVNRVVRYSVDGINFIQLHTVGRTDFVVNPNRVLFCASNGSATYGSVFTLFSWKET